MPTLKTDPDFVRINGKWSIRSFEVTRTPSFYREMRDKVSTLYAIECAGFFKIGIADNFKARMSSINSSCPLDVTKFAIRTVPRLGARYAEQWIHLQMSDRRVKGEWFRTSPQEILSLLPHAIQRAKTYARHCSDYCNEYEREKGTPEFQSWANQNYLAVISRERDLLQKRIEEFEPTTLS